VFPAQDICTSIHDSIFRFRWLTGLRLFILETRDGGLGGGRGGGPSGGVSAEWAVEGQAVGSAVDTMAEAEAAAAAQQKR